MGPVKLLWLTILTDGQNQIDLDKNFITSCTYYFLPEKEYIVFASLNTGAVNWSNVLAGEIDIQYQTITSQQLKVI